MQDDSSSRDPQGSGDDKTAASAAPSLEATFVPGAALAAATLATASAVASAPGSVSTAAADNASAPSASAGAAALAVPAAHAAGTSPQQMTLRVAPAGDAASAVDIRVTERAGQMQVTVHTPDAALEANLRQNLPELVSSLDRAGFDAQTFVPRPAGAPAVSSLEAGWMGSQSDASASGGGPGSGSGNPRESGFGGQHSPAGQQFSGQNSSGQNQARDRQRQRWLEQMEE